MASQLVLRGLLVGSLGSLLLGCPAPSANDGGNDSASEIATDSTAADSASIDVADAAVADVTDAAVMDAPASFLAMTTLTMLNQNCMPSIPRDPLTITGMVSITNTGATPIGPLTIDSGLVMRLLGGDTLATFRVGTVTIPEIPPGGNGSAMFAKTADSLMNDAGASGCDIVMCDTPARIVLDLSGPNIPPGSRASSEPLSVPCSH